MSYKCIVNCVRPNVTIEADNLDEIKAQAAPYLPAGLWIVNTPEEGPKYAVYHLAPDFSTRGATAVEQ